KGALGPDALAGVVTAAACIGPKSDGLPVRQTRNGHRIVTHFQARNRRQRLRAVHPQGSLVRGSIVLVTELHLRVPIEIYACLPDLKKSNIARAALVDRKTGTG